MRELSSTCSRLVSRWMTRFLDLCAGTGAVGIEAISRGAVSSLLSTAQKVMCLIEENLDKLEVPESQTEVLNLEAENFTGREHQNGWDIIFFDPPYESIIRSQCTIWLKTYLLNESGVLVIEHHTKKNLKDAIGTTPWRILKQGETISLYENASIFSLKVIVWLILAFIWGTRGSS